MKSAFLKRYLFAVFLILSFFTKAQNIPNKPALLYPIYDKANLLSESEKSFLNQKLIKFSDSSSTEIQVIILPTTSGQDVNFLATMYGQKWGIGQKGVDNGVVFLIATEDKTMSIQQGRAVEKYLTASVAGQIMDYMVTPAFKNGDWYKGIDNGTSAIMDAVRGKFKPIVKNPTNDGSIDFGTIFFVLIVIIIAITIFKQNNGGGNDDDYTLSRGGRRRYNGGIFPPFGGFGGGFGGGSSSGGFGGFGGGGSFGGGGASGGW